MDLNKVMIIGRLTRDPEVRATPSGISVASVGVATGYVWTDQSGQKQEKTEFHNVVMWRRLAEIAGQYLQKGSQVYIEGRLETRSWDQDGIKRYKTEIIADNMIMLARPTGSTGPSGNSANKSFGGSSAPTEPTVSPEDPAGSANSSGSEEAEGEDIRVEDIPF